MEYIYIIAFLLLLLCIIAVIVVSVFTGGTEVYNKAEHEGTPTDAFSITGEQFIKWFKSRDEKDFAWTFGDVPKIAEALQTDLHKGLTGTDFDIRKKHFGINKYKSLPMRGFFAFWFDTLEDKTLRILLGSSIVSIVLGVTVSDEPETGWIEGAAILFAVLLVSLVTAGNDFSKDRKFRQLSAVHKDKKVKVIRQGKPQLISTFDLLVGDVVSLETGDYIPADALYISGHGCSVDESSMTGEPLPIKKNDENPFFISGCMVVEGSANAVVVATGMNSVFGQLKAMIDKEGENTPLQEKLDELADFIGKCGALAAGCTFVALVAMWAIRRFVLSNDGWDWHQLPIIVNYLITSITIVAVAVPEGLPLAVTISLAYSMMKMMKDQNLVRHLAACETMGGATQICSDKTGTLTQNKMTVTDAWISGVNLYNDEDLAAIERISPQSFGLFKQGISVNSSANIVVKPDGKEVNSGAPTEIALFLLLRKLRIDYSKERELIAPRIIQQFPFSSNNKRMTTVVRHDDNIVVYTKGASEVILGKCTHYMNENGEEKRITVEDRKRFEDSIEKWANRGLRTLSLAYKIMDKHTRDTTQDEFETDIILSAIVGISDPVRPEVPQAVANCQKAGITVRMLTGDNARTAEDIARQCGIMTDKGIVMEGPIFRKLPDNKVDEIIDRLVVMARCSPDDKLRLVQRLKARGEVVAVTGDGTNDAPQLREADVGFAMGISGTEVAKDASDIILLDDNFSSIEKAVLWGRNVYDSIRKFVQFQLTVNICAVIIAFVGALTTGESPLKAVQLLWVNLIMDTFAALALATDNPSKALLNRMPHGRNSPLISRVMWNFIIGSAIFQLIVLFTLLYTPSISFLGIFAKAAHEEDVTRTTIIFNTFVFMQLWNEINSRKLDNSNVFAGIFSNSIFIVILVLTVVVQFLLVQFGGHFSHTTPLNSEQWLFSTLLGALSLPIAYLLRSIPVAPEKFEVVVPPTEPEVPSAEVDVPGAVVEEPLSPRAPEVPVVPQPEQKVTFQEIGKKVIQSVRFRSALKGPSTVNTLRYPRFYKEKVVIT